MPQIRKERERSPERKGEGQRGDRGVPQDCFYQRIIALEEEKKIKENLSSNINK